ncbi:glucoamylase family protein, partial [Rhodobaculum claviforme]|uniref:glucoamylase family protein n=1 Tax=Rhodobaculum claviforme TaxID=1549854 RepID=UPI001F5CAF32
LGVAGGAVVLNPGVWPLVLPFALLWLASPAIAHRISQPAATRRAVPMTAAEVTGLRLIARATWRYFETFVTAEDNFLPPDNFQETPRPVLARRTSPTNIGMYLLSVTAAHDLGWIGRGDALARLERTLATMQRMPRFRGHLHNWHATDDLRVLEPGYVSSVDSGNLAGHLIAVAQACADWQAAPQARDADWRAGLDDGLRLAGRALAAAPDPGLADLLGRLETALAQGAPLGRLLALAAEAAAHARAACDPAWDVAFWCAALHAGLAGHAADRDTDLRPRLAAAERTARDLATGMDFAFLLDRDKMLLSIGFSLATNRLDHSCYDLLASEARLASLFAIAKGDVETRHWFRLGRAATPLGTGTALVSWSGSMFEYLMPSLVLQEPGGSVLEDTNHRIVARQQAHAGALGIPWGISESAYNARDLEMTYQYSNFGVPGLGLKRGLGSDRVIAPYATALAAMVAPAAALRNLARLADLGAEGRYGFHEAVDFTPARLPAGADRAVVRSFMAHHQGMTIAAIANCVQDGRLRARFHAEPMIRAVELLLQERVPRDATDAPPRAREVRVTDPEPDTEAAVRRFPAPAEAMPTAHLLSNGTYGVVLTPGGAGFSRWRDLAVTRWRGDPTSAAQGAFILMRDRASGRRWSAGVQPTGADPARHSAVFSEHHAAFTHRGDGLTTVTEVVVSAEDDAEARRVTLTNTAGRAREIELTSCAELVLAPAAADAAHPAFSKLFVVTDFLPELGVVIATRRRRSAADPEVWAAHIAVVEGTEAAPLQFETDRARFIGAGGSMGRADMATAPLSQTTGTVLDPMLAIRRSVVVPAGGMARVTFWTMVADDPGVLLDLVDRHRDPSAFGRAVTLAWTQAQVQLRHLDVAPAAAADFQRLGGMLLRGDSRLRTSAAGILRGAGPQSALWPMGISGDLPLIVFRIQDTEDTPGLLELLAAHEYLRMHQLAVDVVILNDRATSYVQDLQTTIETAVRSARSRPRPQAPEGLADGTVHVLRSDIIGPDARALVLAVAGVVLVAGRGRIGQQIDAAVTATAPRTRAPDSAPDAGPDADPDAGPEPDPDTDPETEPGTGRRGPCVGPRGGPDVDPGLRHLRSGILQRAGRLCPGRARIRHGPARRADHACALDQRDRQPRLRVPDLGAGGGACVGHQQPREPDHAVVERPRHRPGWRGAFSA